MYPIFLSLKHINIYQAFITPLFITPHPIIPQTHRLKPSIYNKSVLYSILLYVGSEV